MSSSSTSSSPPNQWRPLTAWTKTRQASTSSGSSLSSNFLRGGLSDQSRRRAEEPPHEQPVGTGSFWARRHKEPEPSTESTKRKQPPEVSSSQEVPAKKAFPGRSEEKALSRSSTESDYATPIGSATGSPRQAPGLEGTSLWLRNPWESSPKARSPDRHVGDVSGLQPTATPGKSPQKSLHRERSTADLHQRTSASPAPTSQHGAEKSVRGLESPEGSRRHDASGLQPPETPRRQLQGSPHHEAAASVPRRITRASVAAALRSVQGVEGSAPRAESVRRRRERQTNGSRAPAESPRKQDASKKPVRKRAGYRVLQDIIRQQKSTQIIIPRLPFARVVREILWRITGEEFKMQKLALQALHEASETVIVALLEGSNMMARFARRVTIMNRDLAILLTIIRTYGNLERSLD